MSETPSPKNPSTPPTPASAPAGAGGEPKLAPAPHVPLPHIFRWRDWAVALATFLVAFGFFVYHMSPSVTLQDSGELVTGAYHFGVPHPPGYPLWSFLGWVWRHVVPIGSPAYRICLMSAFTGALVVGVMTLFMSRSILMLVRATPWAESIRENLQYWLALLVGASAALLFGFNRGVWLWASVPEMRVLNVFFFTIMTFTFFAWLMQPDRRGYLYATLLLLGLGVSNHQTVVVMALPILVGTFVRGWWYGEQNGQRVQNLSAFLEVLVAFLVAWVIGVLVFGWLQLQPGGFILTEKVKMLVLFGPETPTALVVVLGGGGAIALLAYGAEQGWLQRKRALILTGLFLLGVSFYLYMPIASSTNPPMNWGYASTKQGFLHAVLRGQYEKVRMANLLGPDFPLQIRLQVEALMSQYSWPLALFAFVPLAALIAGWRQIHALARSWLIFIFAAFLTTLIGLLIVINPQLDKQQQEIVIKFFAPAHGFYGVLIGYGLALTLAALIAKWPKIPGLAVRLVCIALLAVPTVSYTRNKPLCDQRGHDFGYQFGYRMFHPGGGYPDLDKNAVLYGGTDPGRFVPTYMIFCESRAHADDKFQDSHLDPEGGRRFDRRDVYIITQNALADSTYMNYIRDHYDYSRPDWNNPATIAHRPAWQQHLFGWSWTALDRQNMYPAQPIWIPSENDVQAAFQEYVADFQRRMRGGESVNPDEQVDIINGRVSVRGVGGVMRINGILTKWIFDRNKDKHSFYVEESYVIPWMYPHLSPAGIIMKINRDPLPAPAQNPTLWQQIISRDRAYWDKLQAEFMARREFRNNSDAQKTFSKLRSAIGGLYSFHRLHAEAEYAYQQARLLCPESPEANFRLAQLYMELNRHSDADRVLAELQKLDPLNNKIDLARQQIRQISEARSAVPSLENARISDPTNVRLVTQLAQAYLRGGLPERIPPMLDAFLAQTNLSAADMIQIPQLYIAMGQVDRAISTLNLILQRHPQDSQSYYALAIILGMQGAADQALMNLERAIQITPGLRDQARTDRRLDSLRPNPRFQQIVGGANPFSGPLFR